MRVGQTDAVERAADSDTAAGERPIFRRLRPCRFTRYCFGVLSVSFSVHAVLFRRAFSVLLGSRGTVSVRFQCPCRFTRYCFGALSVHMGAGSELLYQNRSPPFVLPLCDGVVQF